MVLGFAGLFLTSSLGPYESALPPTVVPALLRALSASGLDAVFHTGTPGLEILLGFFLAGAVSSISRDADGNRRVRLGALLTRHTAAVSVLAACLTATALLWTAARRHTERYEISQFENSIETLRRSLVNRVERYEDALLTIRSALQVLGADQLEQWDQFSRLLTEKELPPGIQFIGVLEMGRPSGADPASLSGNSAAKGVWQVSRVTDPSAETPESAENRKRIVEWFASSEALEQAVGHARQSGRLGVGPLALRPAGEAAFPGQPEKGFFIALPLASAGGAIQASSADTTPAPPAQSCLVAFVDSSVMIEALENGDSTGIDYELFSGRRPHSSSLLEGKSRDQSDNLSIEASLERAVVMRVGGQDWTLQARSFATAIPFYQNLANQVLFGGLATTALLFTIALRTDRRRSRSERRAQGLSRRFALRSARLNAQRSEGAEALRSSEERYTLAAQAALDGLWDWNLQTNEIDLSARWKALLGFGENELGNKPDEWLDRIHPEDRERFQARLSDHLEGRTARFELEYRMLHRDGQYRWVLSRGLAVRDAEGNARRIAGSQTDVTARRQAEKRVIHASLHDPLTGLPNRGHFMERLATSVQNTKKQPKYLFALLFLDVDRFKVVNDSLGHLVGDELLVSIGRRLKTCLRPTDTIARLGGDEFAILLDDLHKFTEATCIADRIQKSFTQPFDIAGQQIFTAVSIGITFGSAEQNRAEDLLRNADTAMYRAKAHGKARYELFDQGMSAHGIERLQMENDLRRGLERDEFVIYYQPIVSLTSGQITGCEALLRWRHPERGIVMPDEFIPLAEETGLITPLSEWVTLAACRQVSIWSRAGLPPLQLAINVSPRQFRQQDVLELVTRALAESEIDPALLQLELTESSLMEDADAVIKPLVELYERGVQISLDDFGTGYSSLIYLQRFPISVLKISESFIRHVVTSPGDAAIASGLIALAHSLDLTVVVEGVETPEQLAFLQTKNCEAVQGHVVSPPLDAPRFVQFLKQWRGLSVPV